MTFILLISICHYSSEFGFIFILKYRSHSNLQFTKTKQKFLIKVIEVIRMGHFDTS